MTIHLIKWQTVKLPQLLFISFFGREANPRMNVDRNILPHFYYKATVLNRKIPYSFCLV